MKAKVVVKRWEENAMTWPQAKKDAIEFARITRSVQDDPDAPVTGLWAVYRKGTILQGDSALLAVAQGAAVEVDE